MFYGYAVTQFSSKMVYMLFTFNQFLKSQSGMSLVEIAIGLGLAGGAALGVASLMGQVGKSGGDSNFVVERTQFASSLGVYLFSPTGCQTLKTSLVSASDFSETEENLVIRGWNFGGIKEFPSTDENQKLKYLDIVKLTAQLEPMPPGSISKVTIPVDGGGEKELGKRILVIRAGLQKYSKSRNDPNQQNTNPVYPYEYRLPVLVDNDGKLEKCGDTQSLAEVCRGVGGNFNSSEQRCLLPETCSVHGSYIQFSCSYHTCNVPHPGGILPSPNPITNAYSCPQGSVATITGGDQWQTRVQCGRKCEQTVNYSLGFFTCLKCPTS